MTSTDFASRYRLLKNVATRGARSFLAQQVALGRMVMVHYLDSETPEQRSEALARLEALKPPTREKLLEIVDVDGSPVAVTLFISSFADFTTWLDHVSAPVAAPQAPPVKVAPQEAGDFTRAFSKVETPAAPPVMAPKIERTPQRQAPNPPPPSQPAARPAGEFTRIFGKVDAGEATPAPAARAQPKPSAKTPDDVDSPTLIMESPKAAPRPAPAAPPPAPAEGGGFTAIFGRIGETRLPDELPAETPKAAQPTAAAGSVMQPAPIPDFRQSSGPLPPPPSVPPAQSGGGEFTQLFQRLSATAAPPPSAPPAAAPPMMAPPSFGLPSEPPRSTELPQRPDLMPPPLPSAAPPMVLPAPSLGAPTLPAPSLGSSLPAPALGMSPPPPSPSGPRPPQPAALPSMPPSAPNVMTPSSPWGAAPPPASGGSIFGSGGAQSEYTRILGKVTVPPPPPIAIQPPAAANAAAPGQKPSKSMLPLIVALNVLLLLTVAIVGYFVFRK